MIVSLFQIVSPFQIIKKTLFASLTWISVFIAIILPQNFELHRRRKRGGGGGGGGGRGGRPPNNLKGGGNIPFAPPPPK